MADLKNRLEAEWESVVDVQTEKQQQMQLSEIAALIRTSCHQVRC